ncbi:hypothetical protein V6N11_058610 [Hibiscus sabdariffa]|uniref:Uncharacterized protein n=1 Tax=Hibiscus sabdariffa TaxID=183260 RepID=A0ABR2U4R8_9ROSI
MGPSIFRRACYAKTTGLVVEAVTIVGNLKDDEISKANRRVATKDQELSEANGKVASMAMETEALRRQLVDAHNNQTRVKKLVDEARGEQRPSGVDVDKFLEEFDGYTDKCEHNIVCVVQEVGDDSSDPINDVAKENPGDTLVAVDVPEVVLENFPPYDISIYFCRDLL